MPFVRRFLVLFDRETHMVHLRHEDGATREWFKSSGAEPIVARLIAPIMAGKIKDDGAAWTLPPAHGTETPRGIAARISVALMKAFPRESFVIEAHDFAN